MRKLIFLLLISSSGFAQDKFNLQIGASHPFLDYYNDAKTGYSISASYSIELITHFRNDIGFSFNSNSYDRGGIINNYSFNLKPHYFYEGCKFGLVLGYGISDIPANKNEGATSSSAYQYGLFYGFEWPICDRIDLGLSLEFVSSERQYIEPEVKTELDYDSYPQRFQWVNSAFSISYSINK